MIYPKVKEMEHKVTAALEDGAGNPYAVIEFMEEQV